MIGQAAIGARAKPGGKTTFLGDGREGMVGVTGAKNQLLAAGLPAEFLDKQLGETPAVQEGAGALEVERHRSVFTDAEGADDFGFAGFDVILRDAQAVLLMEGEDKGDELFVANAGAKLAVEQITSGFGQRRFVDVVNRVVEGLDVEQAVLDLGAPS